MQTVSRIKYRLVGRGVQRECSGHVVQHHAGGVLLFPSDADFFSNGHMPSSGIWLDANMLATRHDASTGEFYYEYREPLVYPN